MSAAAQADLAPQSQPEAGRSLWARLGPARWLGLLWATAPAITGITLIASLGTVSDWLLAHPEVGLLIYISVFMISAGFGLLPTYAQSILGGWVFGLWVGFGAAIVAFTGASLIGYIIARTVSKDRVEDLVESNPKSRIIKESLIGQNTWKTIGIVTLLRLPTNSPFALTNLAMASVGVRLFPFLVGTAVGMAPRTGLAAYLAAWAQATGAESIQDFARERGWWLIVIGVVGMVVVLGIIGAIANHALNQMAGRNADRKPC